ncbi:hypothetical protein GCM10009039_07410 [Halocalculus aciditolerans]|uniref:Small CPxCG-related zinc finger protein n=1 Tax=Halocalculus aciditolerans TaxID=1383812 RepID=A0A830F921_9EURY|nr:hypothetical protein GCM10009039_07410 [Halocalculus aciditolerans]
MPARDEARVMSDDEQGGRPCPMCETPMYKRHCKYVCPQHGVVVDCSDPFVF